jgi:nucleotide-binding universal stress UspA family protein
VFSRVLFPTDCSPRARALVALLGGMDPRPEQVCAAVVVPISGMEQPVIEEHLNQAKRDIDELVAPLAELGIATVTRVLTGRPGPAILKTAHETQSDGILLGSYGKDAMQEVLKGSLSAELTRSAPMPVMSVRFGALWDKTPMQCAEMGRTIFSRPLHPTDMSECSQRALDLITSSLAERVDRLELAHVVDDVYRSSDVHEQEVAAARAYLDSAAAALRGESLETGVHLVEGDPVADILRLSCELGASCLVLGSHGKSLMREAVVGSVSHGILRMASLPVVVMR